jgi:hypothetical protein
MSWWIGAWMSEWCECITSNSMKQSPYSDSQEIFSHLWNQEVHLPCLEDPATGP